MKKCRGAHCASVYFETAPNSHAALMNTTAAHMISLSEIARQGARDISERHMNDELMVISLPA